MDADVPDRNTCPRCGSRHLARDVGVAADQGLTVVLPPPNTHFWSVAHSGPVRANVCGDCGNVEFFVTKHAQFWEKWRQGNA